MNWKVMQIDLNCMQYNKVCHSHSVNASKRYLKVTERNYSIKKHYKKLFDTKKWNLRNQIRLNLKLLDRQQ